MTVISQGKMNINLLDEIPKRLILWDYVRLTNSTYVISMQRYKKQVIQRNIIIDPVTATTIQTFQNICTTVNNKKCNPSGLNSITI
jgi:hypothetical protein